ncbi:general secretion pathway protein G [Terrimicrobium sacchariphilum]|jgi:general secretion pathway protein G|uniref:General secretion pathway protein G n=1 Tax=Terrimicrobium sacchariphilum TaxID=690879 RepID=A0A146G3K1_TERSA|nr:prepilin-type N-terminal cleavage/methylation domain-containing protein [Terrimicrobium sacchariphilum]GAT32395.1 general secretion pathway protein G [Terrimicrobium sacchariphilum]
MRCRISFSTSHRAFTLLELLAAVAIIGALAAILLPSLGVVRNAADGGRCVSNLRNIALAFKSYAQDNDGYLPAPRYANPGTPTSNPNPLGSTWQLELAPYTTGPLKANNIYRLKEVPIGRNAQICPTYLKMFPSQTAMRDSGLNAAGYGMNINLNVSGQDINFGGRIYNRFKEISIMRPATSIIVGDSADYHIDCRTGTWQYAAPTSTKPDGCNSGAPLRHKGKANYLFADGHVETLTPDQALPLLQFNP